MKIIKYTASGKGRSIDIKSILINVFHAFYTPFELLLLQIARLLPSKPRNIKYNVSICLIFKDEAKYLQEWIEYHKIIGVDHFYLYNNFSEDDYMDILNPYIDAGDVTLIDWPYKFAQIRAYEDAYKKFKDETQWLGYIDTDEFINLRADNSIKDMLNRFRKYPSVFFHWRMFGTSGLSYPPQNFRIIANYTSSWENLCNVGKTFINTDYKVKKIRSVHYMISSFLGFPLYPCSLNGFPNIYFKTVYSKTIPKLGYINHYWSKSYQEYYIKDFVRGDAVCPDNTIIRTMPGRFEYHELMNQTKDFSIQRWLVFLSQKLNKQ